MSVPTIPGFRYERLTGDDGIEIATATGGSGEPIVLLHGFPQTHLMWRHVAPDLARTHTVICPDLRGYGNSDKPEPTGPDTYAKRTMARDIIAVARNLGHERFALVGHDRGALVAVRAGLDHPQSISHLGILDVLPTIDMWNVLHGVQAAVAWHLYLMAQPAPLPERMITAVADDFFGSFLDGWGGDASVIPADIRAHYLDCSRGAIASIVADYRASAGVDLEQDTASRDTGHQLTMPVGVLSQDWGSQLGFNAGDLWKAWAPDFEYHPIEAGHFAAESHPTEVAQFIQNLIARPLSRRD